jgi:hypothetical protein
MVLVDTINCNRRAAIYFKLDTDHRPDNRYGMDKHAQHINMLRGMPVLFVLLFYVPEKVTRPESSVPGMEEMGMMKPKGIKRQIKEAMESVMAEIRANAKGGGYAAALSSEGYAGGYQQCLCDVIAALNGVPASSSRFWPRG